MTRRSQGIFPADTVVPKMFEVFVYALWCQVRRSATMPRSGLPIVRLYRVTNTTDNATVGYLYLTFLTPRDGNYSSFMESTLIKGRVMNSSHPVPVVAVVANCPAPAKRHALASDHVRYGVALPRDRPCNARYFYHRHVRNTFRDKRIVGLC